MENTEVTQETEPEHPRNASDPWAQFWDEEAEAWAGGSKISSSTPADEQESCDPPIPASPMIESEEVPTSLVSPDQQMKLTLRKFLGEGAHGTVVSADWAEGDRQVAVKVSHKLFISELDCTEPGLRDLKNELDVLKALKRSREHHRLGSNFLPELLKSWQDDTNVYFVMDLYPWNLEGLRWATPDWDASTEDKILWTAEMVCF